MITVHCASLWLKFLNFDLSLKAHKSEGMLSWYLVPFSRRANPSFLKDFAAIHPSLAIAHRLPLDVTVRIGQFLFVVSPPSSYSFAHRPPLAPLALLTVARPRARPTPLPRVPRDRNMGAFL